jgi:EAL domain-containing protein (putative c-di-GMP-specific phosphodiesterase class I)
MLMEGSEHTADALARLRFENIAIAIDDFGTGYSSLSDLKTLPVDYLKIDHDFTRSVGTDDSDKAIAGSIIHLAHSLKLKVIAEGVEQAGAQAVLSELGCDEFQGNLFSAPLGAEKMPAVLSRCA